MMTPPQSRDRASFEEILADYAARREGPNSSVYRVLELVQHDDDFQRLFDRMPAPLQQAATRMAVYYRGRFDELRLCYETDPSARRFEAAFEKWAQSRPDVVDAPPAKPGKKRPWETTTLLENAIASASSEEAREVLRAELKEHRDALRYDENGCELVTGWHREVIERRERMEQATGPRAPFPIELLRVDDPVSRYQAEVVEHALALTPEGESFAVTFDKLRSDEQAAIDRVVALNRGNLEPVLDAAKGDAKWFARWKAFRDWAKAR